MNWAEFAAARQLLAEERVGRAVRTAEYAEDEAFASARKLLGG